MKVFAHLVKFLLETYVAGPCKQHGQARAPIPAANMGNKPEPNAGTEKKGSTCTTAGCCCK